MRAYLHALLVLAYGVLLVFLTLIVAPQPQPTPNLVPFRTIAACYATGGEIMIVNLLGNLALLAPIGMILEVGSSQRVGATGVLLAGLLLSTTIESIQFVCGHRMADVDDVLLNTLGAVLAFAIMRGVQRGIREGARLYAVTLGGKRGGTIAPISITTRGAR